MSSPKMIQYFPTEIFLILSALLVTNVYAANILALVVTPSPSHHIWNRALTLELAHRGHHVTVVTPDPEKQKYPNYTEIIIEGMYEEVIENYDYTAMSKESILQNYASIFQWGTDGCEKGLQSKGAKQLLELVGKQSFDLIIVEAVVDECFHAFVPLFGSPPVIAITAYSLPPWAAEMSGSPNTPSYINVGNLPYPQHLTFIQRTINFIVHSFVKAYRRLIHLPKQHEIAQKYLGKNIPPIEDIEKNISIILSNIHYSYDYTRPLTPSLIPIGGMHIKPAKQLPKELQEYLDDAPEGVILFSLGSNVRSDKLDGGKRKILLEALAQLKQKVLWKWESDSLPDQPKNVKIAKWLPQNDILGHPNTRLFITHGGLLSTQEAMYHGVPVVGIPFLADQFINLQRNVVRGVAEKLDISNITPNEVLSTLTKVLYDPSYKERMKVLSNQFRDRPDTPLNTAVWWTEYVIRNKGADHLRSAALELSWYQYFLLDLLKLLKSICLTSWKETNKQKRN
ncbi:UDP-glucuronosyltransferase, partial [Gryllus bimaculatus]